MQALLAPLAELADYQDILKDRKKERGFIQISGCVGSQKTHLMYALGDGFEYRVIVFSSEEKAKKAYEEYRIFTDDVFFYPARDLLFYYADIKGRQLTDQRMGVLRALMEKEDGKDITVITVMDAFLDGLAGPEQFKEQKISLAGGDEIDLSELERSLTDMGYERESQIEGPGQFAVRGGIMDVYPLTEELPVRIELWGEEIDSLRSFDVESQRSVENLESVVIYPASENWQDTMETVPFLEYFPEDRTILLLDEPKRLQEMAEEAEQEYFRSRENRIESGMEETAESGLTVYATQDIISRMNGYSGIPLTTLESRCGAFHVRETYSLQTKSVNPYNNSFEMLTRDLKRLKRSGYRVVLLSGSRTRAKRLAEDLRDYDLSSFYSEDMEREVKPGEIMAAYGYAAEGYEYPMLKFMVISESDIFGRNKKKKRRKR